MKRISSPVVALIFGWISLAQAEVSVDPFTRPDGINAQRPNASKPDAHSIGSDTNQGVILYTGRHAFGDPNRYLGRSIKQGKSESESNSSGPVYNPITINWK